MKPPIVLDLCAGSAAWSKPWSDHGYNVWTIDLEGGQDVRLQLFSRQRIYAILAAPPCTEFASSGARWWKSKGDDPLIAALAIADACARIVLFHSPTVWCMESPVGRLRRFIGPPKMTFQPCDYGDPYTKRTLLWGNFCRPKRSPVEPVRGSTIHLIPGGPNQAALRSITPPGFARAFFEANRAPWWNAPNLEDH